MRRLILAVATVSVMGAGTLLATAPASAMALPGAANTAQTAADTDLKQDVALVCRPVWNGWRWVRRCWRTGPPVYYAPRYYRPRPRFYYY